MIWFDRVRCHLVEQLQCLDRLIAPVVSTHHVSVRGSGSIHLGKDFLCAREITGLDEGVE